MPYKDIEKQKEHSRNHARRNVEKYRQQARDNKKRKIEWLAQYKEPLECKICGEKESCCLDFHHIDKTTKITEVSVLAHSGHSLSKIIAEIKKCILVCANCHRKIHFGKISLDTLVAPTVDRVEIS